MVEPLPRHRHDILGIRQSTRGGAHLVPARLLITPPGSERAPAEPLDVQQQLGADRDRHFGGGRRRRRATVGGKIDQSHVRLMADSGNERDQARRRRPHHDFLVERP